MSIFRKRPGILIFLLLAAMSTIISLAIYTAVQQNYRSNANDPQIEAAQTISTVVDQGVPAEAITGQGDQIDVENSLSLFISLFDKDRKLVSSSGRIGTDSPTPPAGVFDYLNSHTQERFTWEPKRGVRIAAVAQKLSDDKGYVIVGRNMKEIESREMNLLVLVGIAWLVLLILSALLAMILSLKPAIEANVEVVEVVNEVTAEPDNESLA